ncbi:MAG: DNA primase [Candidatus Dormibacteria bacterium]
MAADVFTAIKSRLDIVEVVGGYVALRQSGRDHVGLCPFHSEKSPSFRVSQEKQAYYCFGCNEGGDIFTFVESIEHVGRREALELLAEKAGVELDTTAGASRGGAARRRRVAELNARAASFFEHVLWDTPAGSAGRELLVGRGVDPALARRFGVGFAPAGGGAEDALSRYLRSKAGAAAEELVDAGLAHHARGGGLRDRFRHRLVFPIRDERGETVAFGARALGDDVPKYLNSPETALYHKGSALFGIDHARDALRQSRVAVVVEGYFDVMAAHAGSVPNTVASSGTALTSEQARLLSRLADAVVLCFDADSAGTSAAERAVDVLAGTGVAARICVLPAGYKDPDELVKADPEGFARAVATAQPEWQVLLDRALGGDESGSIAARRAAAERTVALLARIPEAAACELYVQQAARRLGLSDRALAADVASARTAGRASRPVRLRAPAFASAPAGVSEATPLAPPPSWERLLAALCVHRPALAARLVDSDGLDLSRITHPLARRAIETARAIPAGGEVSLAELPSEERQFVAQLLVDVPPELLPSSRTTDLDDAIADCLSRVGEAPAVEEMRAVRGRMADAVERGDNVAIDELAARMRQLSAANPRLRRHALR